MADSTERPRICGFLCLWVWMFWQSQSGAVGWNFLGSCWPSTYIGRPENLVLLWVKKCSSANNRIDELASESEEVKYLSFRWFQIQSSWDPRFSHHTLFLLISSVLTSFSISAYQRGLMLRLQDSNYLHLLVWLSQPY